MAIPLKCKDSLKRTLRTAFFKAQLIKTIDSHRLILCPSPEAQLLDYQKKVPTLNLNGILTVHINFDTRFTSIVGTTIFKNLKQKIIMNDRIENGSNMVNDMIISEFKSKHSLLYDEWERNIPNFCLNLSQRMEQLKSDYSQELTQDCFIKVLIDEKPTTIQLYSAERGRLAMQKYHDTVYEFLEDCFENLALIAPNDHLHLFMSGYNSFPLTRIIPESVKIKMIDCTDSTLNGCCILGLDQSLIQNRVCRYSYGTQYSKLFDPEKDDPNQFKWGIEPNQYIAAYLPFTTAGKPIPSNQIFEQMGNSIFDKFVPPMIINASFHLDYTIRTMKPIP